MSVSQTLLVRPARAADTAAIAAIYNHYIAATTISFEEQPVAVAEMERRIGGVVESGLPWLVAEKEGRVVGYAHASPWKARAAYRHAAECTVYVASDATGCGAGTALYRALLPELERLGYRTVIGGIALPNEASVRLHERFGFEKVAHFREVGFKHGRWVDVAYWQLMLG